MFGRRYQRRFLKAALKEKCDLVDSVEGAGVGLKTNFDYMVRKCVHIVLKPASSEALCALTIPLIKEYAGRIGADVNVVGDTRVFPEYPPTYERMQIFSVGRKYQWNISIDANMLLGPSLADATAIVSRQAVGLIMSYSASAAFSVDNKFFGRDARDIAPVESFLVTSDWTHDLWEPLKGSSSTHMATVLHQDQIAEYALAHNIAKYGLKCGGIFPGGSQIARVPPDTSGGDQEVNHAKSLLREWEGG